MLSRPAWPSLLIDLLILYLSHLELTGISHMRACFSYATGMAEASVCTERCCHNKGEEICEHCVVLGRMGPKSFFGELAVMVRAGINFRFYLYLEHLELTGISYMRACVSSATGRARVAAAEALRAGQDQLQHQRAGEGRAGR